MRCVCCPEHPFSFLQWWVLSQKFPSTSVPYLILTSCSADVSHQKLRCHAPLNYSFMSKLMNRVMYSIQCKLHHVGQTWQHLVMPFTGYAFSGTFTVAQRCVRENNKEPNVAAGDQDLDVQLWHIQQLHSIGHDESQIRHSSTFQKQPIKITVVPCIKLQRAWSAS